MIAMSISIRALTLMVTETYGTAMVQVISGAAQRINILVLVVNIHNRLWNEVSGR